MICLQVEQAAQEVVRINDFLAESSYNAQLELNPKVTADNVSFNDMYLAIWPEDEYLYRVKVLEIVKDEKTGAAVVSSVLGSQKIFIS